MAGIRERVALNIRKIRKGNGLSQEQLADLCGLHRTYIGSVERSERNITIENLDKIANALGVDARDLIE
ncbi:helix-turn-helix domain-containing protein [bacterium]|nr:helix-turn-helix domain-containing protein [bacterium]